MCGCASTPHGRCEITKLLHAVGGPPRIESQESLEPVHWLLDNSSHRGSYSTRTRHTKCHEVPIVIAEDVGHKVSTGTGTDQGFSALLE